jgi:hypothetical protein
MTHEEFVAGYQQGRLRVHIDREAAARFVSGRAMLPLVMLPILGLGVALALVGYVIAGVGIFIAARAAGCGVLQAGARCTGPQDRAPLAAGFQFRLLADDQADQAVELGHGRLFLAGAVLEEVGIGALHLQRHRLRFADERHGHGYQTGARVR